MTQLDSLLTAVQGGNAAVAALMFSILSFLIVRGILAAWGLIGGEYTNEVDGADDLNADDPANYESSEEWDEDEGADSDVLGDGGSYERGEAVEGVDFD